MLVSYQYPLVKFISSVSSGTYIRSLAVDLGESLGAGAHLADLRRLNIGPFDLNNAVSIEGLTIGSMESHLLLD